MKTLKVMGIIGLVVSGLFLFAFYALDHIESSDGIIGWGVIATFYLIAFSIVGIVQAKKHQ